MTHTFDSQDRELNAVPRRKPFDAVSFLTVFLILTCVLPSYLTIPALGSLGRPGTLWGIAGLMWWSFFRLGRHTPLRSGSSAVRLSLAVFVACVLVSYSLASFHGLPSAEASVADSGVLRMAAWVGVAFVANDGIDSRIRFHLLLRRIAIMGALMATLGLAQFWTGQSLTEWMEIPGLTSAQTDSAMQSRSGFVRSAGTASHPLEYAVVLCAALPIATSLALSGHPRSAVARWCPVGVIAIALYVSLSRSALVGLAVGLLVLALGWPSRIRKRAALILVAGSAVAYVAVPGMTGTIRGLFVTMGSDASTASRTSGYDLAFGIADRNPFFGRGFLTLLPQYIILDNQFLGILIELGYIGLAATLTMVLIPVWVAARSGINAHNPIDRQIGFGVASALTSAATMFALFDGLAFPMSAALLFLLIGLAGAAHSGVTGGPGQVL